MRKVLDEPAHPITALSLEQPRPLRSEWSREVINLPLAGQLDPPARRDLTGHDLLRIPEADSTVVLVCYPRLSHLLFGFSGAATLILLRLPGIIPNSAMILCITARFCWMIECSGDGWMYPLCVL